MIDTSDRRLTWIIEVSVSIYLYVLLSLTDLIGKNIFRDKAGWVLVVLTVSIVAINVLVFIWKSFCKAAAYIKQKFPNLFIDKASLFNEKASKVKYEAP
jgi:hypothetical protein